MGERQAVAFGSHNKIFHRLEKIGNVATLTPEERRSYEADVKNARDFYNQMNYARTVAMAEGRAKGLAEGRAEGRAEGLAEGLAEGELNGLMKVARKLRGMGLSDKEIIDATGLSMEVVREL